MNGWYDINYPLPISGKIVVLLILSAIGVTDAKERSHSQSIDISAPSRPLEPGTNMPFDSTAVVYVLETHTRGVTLKAMSESPPKPPAPPDAASPPAMDLESLTARLKNSRAVGFFTKLSLKNEIDRLLNEISKHRTGESTVTYEQLRERFDLLLLKVLTLLQDKDKELANDISTARESIWEAFMNGGNSGARENKDDDEHA